MKKKPHVTCHMSMVQGFTLIEFVVIVSIFAIVASVTLFNADRFNSRTTLTNLAHSVAISIRQAQTYGISSPEGNLGVGRGVPVGIVFIKEGSVYTNQYYLFRDINGNTIYDVPPDDLLETFSINTRDSIGYINLDKNNPYENCDGNVYITFRRPDPEAYVLCRDIEGTISSTYAGIHLISPSGREKIVEVWQTGQVSISDTSQKEL